MAKKVVEPQIDNDEDLPLINTGAYVGKLSDRLAMRRIQWSNPYGGNMKQLRDGGFVLPLEQFADIADAVKIGERGKMNPMNGEPYEAYGSTSLEVAIVGFTPVYTIANQAAVKKGARQVALPRGTRWIKWNNGEKEISISETRVNLYFVLRNDPQRQIHSMQLKSMNTDAGKDMINTICALAQDYQRLVSKLGHQQDIPGSFLFWVNLSTTEPISTGKGGFIAHPVITWDKSGGVKPTTLKAMKPYFVSQTEYDEIAEIATAIDEYLAGEKAPNAPQPLDPEVMNIVGLKMGDDGIPYLVGAGVPEKSGRMSLPPAGGGGVEEKMKQSDAVSDPLRLTFSQWLGRNGNDESALDSLLSEHGTSVNNIKAEFEEDSIANVPGRIGDVLKAIA